MNFFLWLTISRGCGEKVGVVGDDPAEEAGAEVGNTLIWSNVLMKLYLQHKNLKISHQYAKKIADIVPSFALQMQTSENKFWLYVSTNDKSL